MKSIILSIVLLLICFENASNAVLVRMKPVVVMKQYDGNSKYPPVPGSKQCGGAGQLKSVRCNACRNVRGVCNIPPLQQIQAEIDYIPAKNINSLSLRIDVEVEGDVGKNIFDDTVLNSGVEQGLRYTLETTTILDFSLNGKKIKVNYVLTDKEDNSIRLCAELNIRVG